MQTVTVNNKTFDIYAENELTNKEFNQLLLSHAGGDVETIYDEDWQEDGNETVKAAAIEAGLKNQTFIYVWKDAPKL